MALIFNPPPNWPAPPSKDWKPVPGWQPDPAWGPAPEGWNFWIEDTAFDAPAGVPGEPAQQPAPEAAAQIAPAETHAQAETAAQAEPTAPVAETQAPEVAPTAPAEDDATRVLPTNAEEAQPSAEAATQTAAPQASPGSAAPYVADAVGAAGVAGNPYQQAPQTNGVPAAGVPGQPVGQPPYPSNYSQPAQGNPYTQAQPAAAYPTGSQPYAQGDAGQQANPYAQTATAAPSGKKNFFATGAGIITIFGSLLVILVIALVSTLVIGGGDKKTSSSSDSYYSSGKESSSSSATTTETEEAGEEEDSGDSNYTTGFGSDVNVSEEDGGKIYTGSGNQIVTFEKPDGLESVAWLEYEFKGADKYSSISFRTLDGKNELTGSIIDSDFNQESKGSYWIDADIIYKDRYTEKLRVEADGEWTIKIHSASKAPVKKIGDTISGSAASAFIYESDAAGNMKAKFTASDKYGGDMRVTAQSEDLKSTPDTLISTNQDSFEGSASVPEGKRYMRVHTYSGEWELTFEGK